MTGPRPKPLQHNVAMLLAGDNAPQGPGGGHEPSKGIGAHHVRARATLVLCSTIRGMTVTEIHCYGPAIFIRLQHGLRGQRPSGTAERFQGCETPQGFLAGGFGAVFTVRPPDHPEPYGPSG